MCVVLFKNNRFHVTLFLKIPLSRTLFKSYRYIPKPFNQSRVERTTHTKKRLFHCKVHGHMHFTPKNISNSQESNQYMYLMFLKCSGEFIDNSLNWIYDTSIRPSMYTKSYAIPTITNLLSETKRHAYTKKFLTKKITNKYIDL